jgi:RNA polymerase sigma factor (TIGR02999 family)
MKSQGEVTQLLQQWNAGDASALEKIIPHVYRELHRIARHHMAAERGSHTLQASALINEAYIRLVDWKNVQWANRCHFFSVGAQMMRKVLIDHARSKGSQKRGGSAEQVVLDTSMIASSEKPMDLVALDETLSRLEQFDPRKSRVVELRIFGGLTNEEAAEAMGVSVITVRRDWKLALAWLRREMSSEKEDEA